MPRRQATRRRSVPAGIKRIEITLSLWYGLWVMNARHSACMALTVLLLICGCNSVQVKVASSFPQDRVKRVAVLQFDQKGYRHTIIDKVSHGVSTAKNRGRLTASLVSVALQDWGRYQVVPRHEIAIRLKAKKLKEEGIIYSLGREAVGKLFGVDAVVIGQVDAYESRFFLMLQSAKVIFTARLMDIATGQEIWKVHVKMKDDYTSEERLIAGAMHEAVEKLRAKIGERAAKPAEE